MEIKQFVRKNHQSCVKSRIPFVQKGFTLIEVILSIVTVSLLAGLSVPVFRTMLIKNDLDVATVSIVQTLRRAQLLSQAVDGDTNWGVKAQSGSITLFKGANYVARDVSFDEIFDIPTTVGIGGITETVYSKFTGYPQATGSTILTTANDSLTLSINEKGMLDF